MARTNWCFLIGWFKCYRSDLSQMHTHGATKLLALILSLRYVARIQTSLNSCDRSQQQNSVAATMIFTCHTRRFVAATCRGDVSQRFVASCVSALMSRSWGLTRYFWYPMALLVFFFQMLNCVNEIDHLILFYRSLIIYFQFPTDGVMELCFTRFSRWVHLTSCVENVYMFTIPSI